MYSSENAQRCITVSCTSKQAWGSLLWMLLIYMHSLSKAQAQKIIPISHVTLIQHYIRLFSNSWKNWFLPWSCKLPALKGSNSLIVSHKNLFCLYSFCAQKQLCIQSFDVFCLPSLANYHLFSKKGCFHIWKPAYSYFLL